MKKPIVAFACLTLGLVVFGVLVASSLPDGLEWVAENLGFASRSGAERIWSPFAGYEAAFVDAPWPARATAGLFGVALMLGLGMLFGRLIRNRGDN